MESKSFRPIHRALVIDICNYTVEVADKTNEVENFNYIKKYQNELNSSLFNRLRKKVYTFEETKSKIEDELDFYKWNSDHWQVYPKAFYAENKNLALRLKSLCQLDGKDEGMLTAEDYDKLWKRPVNL